MSHCLLPTANATRKLLAAGNSRHFDAMHKCHGNEMKRVKTNIKTVMQLKRILTAFEYPVPSKFIQVKGIPSTEVNQMTGISGNKLADPAYHTG